MGDYFRRGYDCTEEYRQQGIEPGTSIDVHGDGIMMPMPETKAQTMDTDSASDGTEDISVKHHAPQVRDEEHMHDSSINQVMTFPLDSENLVTIDDDGNRRLRERLDAFKKLERLSKNADTQIPSSALPTYPSPSPGVIRLYASAYEVTETDGSKSLWAYLPYVGEAKRFVRLPMSTCGDEVRIALFPYYVLSSLAEDEAAKEFGDKPFRRRVVAIDAEATDETISLWNDARGGNVCSYIGTVRTSRENLCYPPVRVVPCAEAVMQSVRSLANIYMMDIAKEPIRSDGKGTIVPMWQRAKEDADDVLSQSHVRFGGRDIPVWEVAKQEKRSMAFSRINDIAYELSTWLLLDGFDEDELRDSIVPAFRILANLTGKVRAAHVGSTDPKAVLEALAAIRRIDGMDAFNGVKIEYQTGKIIESADVEFTHDEARAAFDWCFSPSGWYIGDISLLHVAMSDGIVWPDVIHEMWDEFTAWERKHGLDTVPADVTASDIETDRMYDNMTDSRDIPHILGLMMELTAYNPVEYRYMMGTLADVAGTYAVGRVLTRGITEKWDADCTSSLTEEHHEEDTRRPENEDGSPMEPDADGAHDDGETSRDDDWEEAYPDHPDPFGYDDDDEWDDDWYSPEPDYQVWDYCSMFRGVIAMVDAKTRQALMNALPGLKRFVDPETGTERDDITRMLSARDEE